MQQCQLDALEALRPGELALIVTEAVAPYRDTTLTDRLVEAEREANDSVADAWAEAISEQQEELDSVTADITEVVANYQPELEALAERMADELAEPEQRLDAIRRAVDDNATTFQLDLPERPVGEFGRSTSRTG